MTERKILSIWLDNWMRLRDTLVKDGSRDNKLMYFCINDEKPSEKYKTIWTKSQKIGNWKYFNWWEKLQEFGDSSFFILFFFCGENGGYFFKSFYHFHPLHGHLNISWAITAKSLPLHIASSQTRTRNLWFLGASQIETHERLEKIEKHV